MSKIVFFKAPNGGYYVGFVYNPDFIEILKQYTPYRHRKWHPDKKLWWISALYLEQVKYLASAWFDEIDDRTEPPEPSPRPEPTLSSPYTILYLLPTAPQPVVKAAYKALAKMYHPDTGGDGEKMRLINWAYETIEEMAL